MEDSSQQQQQQQAAAAAGAQRRRRQYLRDFYGLGDAAAASAAAPGGDGDSSSGGAGSSSSGGDGGGGGAGSGRAGGGGGGGQADAAAATDINGAAFDASKYLDEALRTCSLRQLLKLDNDMIAEIKALDSEMKTLVYENYNKFISATDTIRKMKSNVESMESEMSKLAGNLERISHASQALASSVSERRQAIERLGGTHRLLKRLQFLSELPGRLRRAVEMGAHEQAVDYWRRTRSVLRQYGDIASFRRIESQCLATVDRLVDDLKRRLEQPAVRGPEARQAAGLLRQLDQPEPLLRSLYLQRRRQALEAQLKQVDVHAPAFAEPGGGTERALAALEGGFVAQLLDVAVTFRMLFLASSSTAASTAATSLAPAPRPPSLAPAPRPPHQQQHRRTGSSAGGASLGGSGASSWGEWEELSELVMAYVAVVKELLQQAPTSADLAAGLDRFRRTVGELKHAMQPQQQQPPHPSSSSSSSSSSAPPPPPPALPLEPLAAELAQQATVGHFDRVFHALLTAARHSVVALAASKRPVPFFAPAASASSASSAPSAPASSSSSAASSSASPSSPVSPAPSETAAAAAAAAAVAGGSGAAADVLCGSLVDALQSLQSLQQRPALMGAPATQQQVLSAKLLVKAQQYLLQLHALLSDLAHQPDPHFGLLLPSLPSLLDAPPPTGAQPLAGSGSTSSSASSPSSSSSWSSASWGLLAAAVVARRLAVDGVRLAHKRLKQLRDYSDYAELFNADEIRGRLHAAAQSLLVAHVSAHAASLAALVGKAMATPNWLKHKKPQAPRAVWDLILDELLSLLRPLPEALGAALPPSSAPAASGSSSSTASSTAVLPGGDAASTTAAAAAAGERRGSVSSAAGGAAVVGGDVRRLQSLGDQLATLEFRPESVRTALVTALLTAWLESARRTSFATTGWHQMLLDVHYVRVVLHTAVLGLPAQAESPFDTLLDAVQAAAEERCVEPVPLAQTVVSLMCESKLDKRLQQLAVDGSSNSSFRT